MLPVKKVKFLDDSLPIIIKALFFNLRLDDKKELVSQIIRCRSRTNIRSVISEELQFGLRGEERPLLGNFIKCVAHEGNQHVEHSDLCEKGSTDKDDDRGD